MKPTPSPAVKRQRRYRERIREGIFVVEFEAWPSLLDALENHGFAPNGFFTREDAVDAIIKLLSRWEDTCGSDEPTP